MMAPLAPTATNRLPAVVIASSTLREGSFIATAGRSNGSREPAGAVAACANVTASTSSVPTIRLAGLDLRKLTHAACSECIGCEVGVILRLDRANLRARGILEDRGDTPR